MGSWDHVVPLSRQALAILRSVQKLTGHRRTMRCAKYVDLAEPRKLLLDRQPFI
jgi:hypothetical protein